MYIIYTFAVSPATFYACALFIGPNVMWESALHAMTSHVVPMRFQGVFLFTVTF